MSQEDESQFAHLYDSIDDEALMAMATTILPAKETSPTILPWLVKEFTAVQDRVKKAAFEHRKEQLNVELLKTNKAKGEWPRAFHSLHPPKTTIPTLKEAWEQSHQTYLTHMFQSLLELMQANLQTQDANLKKDGILMREFIASTKSAVLSQQEAHPQLKDQHEQEGKAFIKVVSNHWLGWIEHGFNKANQEKETSLQKAKDGELKRKSSAMDELVHLTSFIPSNVTKSVYPGRILSPCKAAKEQYSPQNKTGAELQGQTSSTPQSCSRQEAARTLSQSLLLQTQQWEGKIKGKRRKSWASKHKAAQIAKIVDVLDHKTIQNMINLGIADTQVHNISNVNVPQEEVDSLAFGINFIPRPKPDPSLINGSMKKFIRTVRLKYHFRLNSESSKPQWHIPGTWMPTRHHSHPTLEIALEHLHENLQESPITPQTSQPCHNWNLKQQHMLNKLLNSPDLLVITADKNLGYVICTKAWYIQEAEKHLKDSNYEEVTEQFLLHDEGATSIAHLYHEIEMLTEEYTDQLNSDEIAWITQHKDWSPMKFYITAKVHKKPYAGRPIAPSMNWVTFHLSEWLSAELNPYMDSISTVLKDTTDFLHALTQVNSIIPNLHHKKNIWLVGLDVTALYPNMDINLGMSLMSKFLDLNEHKTTKHREFILKAMHIVLSQGYLQWQGKIYRQKNGAAMGSPFIPPYANIFMFMLEKDTAHRWGANNKLILYKRFIDDVFAVIHGTKEEAQAFIDDLNHIEPSIKLTGDIQKRIIFLDVSVYIDKQTSILQTEVYQKPMNAYPYLPWKSYHTYGMKKGFIKGESIRYARLSSKKKDFIHMIKLFTLRLQKRGYPLSFIYSQTKQVKWEHRHLYLQYNDKDKNNIPLLFPTVFNPAMTQSHLRSCLDKFTAHMKEWPSGPDSLKEKVTISYSLPNKLHKDVLKSRAHKGF